jgi:hypothetical protein
MRDAGYVDGFQFVVNLVDDAVVAHSNSPLPVAAFEFLATRRPRNRRKALDLGQTLPTGSADSCRSSLSALAVKATR